MKPKQPLPKPPDDLPPHDTAAEQGALSCVLRAGQEGSQQEAEALLIQLRPALFYDHRHRVLLEELTKMKMGEHPHAIDMITVQSWLSAQKLTGELFNKLEEAGSLAYLMELLEVAPSVANFGNYLDTLKGYSLRRWCLAKTARLGELAKATELSPEQLREEFSEVYEQSTKIGAMAMPFISVISPSQAKAFEPDEKDFMVGDGLIVRGNIITIGGEAGVGKSRLATTLAVAGARGTNRWMNYPVRAKWKTLILQSENDAIRLKEEFAAVPEAFNEQIRVSDTLSHGLAFDQVEFRRELRRFYESWPFEMLVVDPWNDVCSEEGQKDYKQALLNIAGVFRGVKMPAVIIVAHLRKRGRDEGQRRKSGRELLHELSGSLALGSSSRTVFVVQPVEASMDDPRVVFEVAKANNCSPDWLKEYGTRSAWTRANAAFESIQLDWEAYDNPGEPERRKVTEEMLTQCFEESPAGMKPAQITKVLKKLFQIGESTSYRAIGEDGYLRKMLMRTMDGKLKLKS